ncbi:hypothetical protein ACO0OL_000487 [Hanseniaspora opuntiae]
MSKKSDTSDKNNEQRLQYGDIKFKAQSTILDSYISVNNTKFTGPLVKKYSKKTINYVEPDTDDKLIQFSGFFVLGWMFVFFCVANTFIHFYIMNKSDSQYFWENSTIWTFMLDNLPFVAFVDLVMYLSLFLCYPIIKRLKSSEGDRWLNKIKYMATGFEFTFFFSWMAIIYNLFPHNWITRIFLFLHSIVLLMKIHSYSYYNGFMSERRRDLVEAQKKLKDSPDDDELKAIIDYSKSELDNQKDEVQNLEFPNNITLKNLFTFTMFPVVVYQINYPRNERIRWSYVGEKIAAIFGIIFVMINIAEVFMYPTAMSLIDLNKSNETYKLLKLVLLLTELIPSFITMYVIVWYLIWDAILNCIAELTRFADREFYADWWNSVTWDDFSKYWNVPVHKFLLRHVFHALKNTKNKKTKKPKFSTFTSIFLTFFISSVFHEFAMFMMFKKKRYYIFALQMAQIPLTIIHYKLFKNTPILANIYFWFSICVGPALVCSLYLAF